MSKVLNYIEFLKDYITDRYECRIAKSQTEIEACLNIRKVVFGSELKRDLAKSTAYSPADRDSWDDQSIHIACIDTKTKTSIGSVRITPAHLMQRDTHSIETYRLDLFKPEMLQQTVVASRLAVLSEHRNSPAGMLLACECYRYSLSHNYILSLIMCEPNFYPMYRKLGYVPLGKVNASSLGGYRLPLYSVIHDYEQMRRVGSPFLKIAKELGMPGNATGILWARDFQNHNSLSDLGYETMQDSDEVDAKTSLFDHLSEESQDQIIKNAIKIDCQYGDVVMARDSGDRNFGFVNKGALEIEISPNKSIIIGEGEIFGEIAFLLNTPRSADIIAANDDTEVILLSLSAVKKIDSLEDQCQFWQNLSRILARRILNSNALLD